MGASAYGGHGPGLLAEGWTFAGLATVLLLMRIYVWHRITKTGGWALIWGIVAYTIALVETILSTVAIKHGLGNNFDKIIASGDASTSLKYTYISCFFFGLSMVTSKLSAGSFLLSVHAGVYPKRRLLIHFFMISNIIFFIPNGITMFLQCDPPSALWDFTERKHCNSMPFVDYARFFLVWAGLSDIVISIMAILLLWPLVMRRSLKLVLCFLMSLGIFAAATSFLVAYYVGYLANPDPSYNIAPLFFWGKASTWAVVLAPSVPPVWPLIKPLFGLSSTSLRDSSGGSPKPPYAQRSGAHADFWPLGERSDEELGMKMVARDDVGLRKGKVQHVEDVHLSKGQVDFWEMLQGDEGGVKRPPVRL